MTKARGGAGSGPSRRKLLQGIGLAGAAGLAGGEPAAAPSRLRGTRAEVRKAGPGAPNILLILLDDVGFADLGCYGGEIPTPNIDAVAASGLRYTSFRTTAVCSATRAALLTGLNHHSVGIGWLTMEDRGVAGYRGDLTPDAATIAEALSSGGYSTHHFGKWHVNHVRSSSQAGPMRNWPLQRGFDTAYWFQGHSSDYFRPSDMFDGASQIELAPSADYYLTDDLTDRALERLRANKSLAPDRPWFFYLAYNGAHSPLHARPADRDQHKGRYDVGWDEIRRRRLAGQKQLGVVPPQTELPPRNPDVRPWDQLSDLERTLYARYMEVYAGIITRLDWNIGRLLAGVRELYGLDNTLVVLASDNGASAEGSPTGTPNLLATASGGVPLAEAARLHDIMGEADTFPHYPTGWAMASNTPFRMYKQQTFLGGIADPLIISWPKEIPGRGELRGQFVHVIDLCPTLLDAAGLPPLETAAGRRLKPIEGASIRRTFDGPQAPAPRAEQYYEMNGNRAMYVDGWHIVAPRAAAGPGKWQLYHQAADINEIQDLAGEMPERVSALQARWAEAARRYDVDPVDYREVIVKSLSARGEDLGRGRWDYFPPIGRVSADVAPPLAGRDHVITVELARPMGSEDGVLVAYGAMHFGWVLYVQDGRLVYETAVHPFRQKLVAESRLPAGLLTVSYRQTMIARPFAGAGALYLGDAQLTAMNYGDKVLYGAEYQGLEIGSNHACPVSDAYAAPFSFAGQIRRVRIECDPTPFTAQETAAIQNRLRLKL
jgi:arylsulfatase